VVSRLPVTGPGRPAMRCCFAVPPTGPIATSRRPSCSGRPTGSHT
jgi:hypothetical protein